MFAAGSAEILEGQHAEAISIAAESAPLDFGMRLGVEDGVFTFEWLGVRLRSVRRLVHHPIEHLVIEYGFEYRDDHGIVPVCCLYLTQEGEWYEDAECSRRLRGKLRRGSDVLERLAVALLDSDIMKAGWRRSAAR